MIKLTIRDDKGKDKVIQQNWISTRTLLDGLTLLDEKIAKKFDYISEVSKFIAKVMGVTQEEILDGVASWEWDGFENSFWTQLMGGVDDPEAQAEQK